MIFPRLPDDQGSLGEISDKIKVIVDRIHQAVDFGKTLHITLEEIREILGVDRVLVYRFVSPNDGVIEEESIDPKWMPLLGKLIYDPCFNAVWVKKYIEGDISIIEDIQIKPLDSLAVDNIEPCYKDLLNRLQVRANLAIPILVKSQNYEGASNLSSNLWGLLMAHQCSRPHHWEHGEINLCKTVALQLGNALKQRKICNCHPQFHHNSCQMSKQNDYSKTKAQLIRELQQLRGEVAALKQNLTPSLNGHVFSSRNDHKTIVSKIEPRDDHELQETNPVQNIETPEHLGQYTIVLVDDSDIDRATYIRYLKWYGDHNYHIIEFDNGEDALIWCNHKKVDLFLVDYYLPDMEGLEFLQKLRQQMGQDTLPVIMITGQGNTNVAVELFKEGAQDYLDKNQVTAEILHRSIINILRHTELMREKKWQQEQQRLINKTALSIRESLKLDEILNTTVTEVRNILQSDRVIIYQIKPDGSGQVVTESVVHPLLSILGNHVDKDCFNETWVEAYCQGRTRSIDDIYTELNLSDCHREFLENIRVRANLVVPILQGENLWGLLIAHQCTEPRHWNQAELELMSQLATHVAIALQQATLIEKLQTELRERRQAELALQEREQTLRLFFKYAPASMAMLDLNMNYIMISQRRVDDYKLGSIESVIGRSHYELFPDIPDRWRQNINHCLAGGTAKCDEDLFVRADGTKYWLKWEMRPWYNIANEIGGIIILAENITERKEAQLSLKEREETLKLFVKYSPAGIAMLDTNMNYVIASQRWIDDYQLDSIESILGKCHYEIFPEISEDWRKIHQRCLAGATEKREEDVFIRQDGTQQWLRWEIRPWYNNDNNICGIIIFSEDITNLKKAQLSLQEINLGLEQKIAERTAEISHYNELLIQELALRKQAEQDLLISEHRLQFLVNSSPAVIFSCEPGANYYPTSISENVYEVLGYQTREILSNPSLWTAHIHPEDLPTVLHDFLLIYEKYSCTLEYRFLHPDNSYYWVLAQLRLIRDSAGKPLEIMGYLVDNNERKTLEQELAAREQLVNSFFDAAAEANIGLAIQDTKHRFLKINQTLADINGHSIEAHINKTIWDIIPGMAPHILPLLERVIETKEASSNLEFAGILSSNPGVIRHWLISHFPILGVTGNTIAVGNIVVEISERMQAEKALRESEERYRSVIAAMSEGIVLQQADGTITACNDSAQKILGLTADQMMGRTSIDPRWRAVDEKGLPFPGENHPSIITLRTGKPLYNVIMGVHKPDGNLTWISINSQPLFQEHEHLPYAVVTSFSDITFRKQAEQALQQQNEREQSIYSISQHIRESLDLDEILNTTVYEVRHFLQTDRVFIYRFNPDRSGVVVTESVSEDAHSILRMEITDTYFVENQSSFSQNTGVKVTNDIYTAGLSPCHIELLEKLQVRAKLVVPILQTTHDQDGLLENTLWGLLIAQQCSGPREWQIWESTLLYQLGTQVSIAIQQSELYHKLALANQQLENLAMIDQLTQVANRRCFDHNLNRAFSLVLREHNPLSLLLCDIDYFKKYNDTYGHIAGDACLKMVGQAFKEAVKRSSDLAARYGGEEFAVILPNTNSEGALQVAQNIHEAIQKLNIPHIASAVEKYVTLSIGIATVIPEPGMVPLDLIKLADKGLYQAKENGRNRSCLVILEPD